jgi:hypothetical protein
VTKLAEVTVPFPTTGYELMALDPDYCGSCPCFTVYVNGTTLEGHCWRVCFDCDGCGLHYTGNKAIAVHAKRLLDAMDWHGEWALKEGLR